MKKYKEYQKELNKGWVDNIVIYIFVRIESIERGERERNGKKTERKLKLKERERVFL